MPNHITNRIEASPPFIDAITRMKDGALVVDFNLVLPMPDVIARTSGASNVKAAAEIALGLVDFSSPPTHDPAAAFRAGNYAAATEVLHFANLQRQLLNGPHPKDFSDADFAAWLDSLRAYRECGVLDWYDWSIANWGTKWNAYDTRVTDTVLMFDTAWSAPHPVIETLAARTKASVLHQWADEDIGSNVGRCRYEAGARVFREELTETRAGYELAFALKPGTARNYKLVDGEYQYFDADEEPSEERAGE